jgi:hypothetical protein
MWVDLQLLLNYISANPHLNGGGPCKNIAILVKEVQVLRLLLWALYNADANGFIRYSAVECHSLKITFSLNCIFLFC